MSTAVVMPSRRSRLTRWLLVLATALFPLAAVACGPLAFGIAFSALNDHSPLLYGLLGVLGIDLVALAVGWAAYGLGILRATAFVAAVVSLGVSGLIGLLLVVEVAAV